MSADIKRLRGLIIERSQRLREGEVLPVASVTNHNGIQLASETFSRQVYSRELTNYKLIKPSCYAFNPSRVNVGSLARNDLGYDVCASPMYTVFERTSPDLDANYLDAFLRSSRFTERVGANLQGSVRDSLSFDALETFPIFLPPLAEQRAIAEVLGAVEEAIAKTEALIEQIKEVSSSLLRNSIASFGSEVNSVDVGSILLEGPKSGLSPICKDAPPGVGVLKLSAVTEGRLNWKDNVKFADVPLQAATQFQLKVGDFLVIRGSGSHDIVGSGCRVTDADLPPFPCIFPDLVIRLRANAKKVIPEYLAVMWRTPVIRGQIRQAAKSTNGIYKINQTDIRELRMPLPSVSLQREIVLLIDGISSRLAAEQRMLVHLVSTRASIAQELLSGRLRLPDSIIARHRDKAGQAA